MSAKRDKELHDGGRVRHCDAAFVGVGTDREVLRQPRLEPAVVCEAWAWRDGRWRNSLGGPSATSWESHGVNRLFLSGILWAY